MKDWEQDHRSFKALLAKLERDSTKEIMRHINQRLVLMKTKAWQSDPSSPEFDNYHQEMKKVSAQHSYNTGVLRTQAINQIMLHTSRSTAKNANPNSQDPTQEFTIEDIGNLFKTACSK